MPTIFDEILAGLPTESTRTALKTALEADEPSRQVLEQRWLAASEFEKVKPELTQLRTDAEGWKKFNTQFPEAELRNRWENYPKVAARATELETKLAEEETKRVAAEAKALAAGEGEEVDINKLAETMVPLIEKQLNGKFVPATVTIEGKSYPTLDVERNRILTHINGVTGPLYAEAARLSARYEARFGKTATPQQIIQLMADNGIPLNQSERAFDLLAAPEIQAKLTADRAKEIEEAEARGAAKARAELQNKSTIPTAEGGSSGFEQFLNQPPPNMEGKELPADYELGSRGGYQAAKLAAIELKKLTAARNGQTM